MKITPSNNISVNNINKTLYAKAALDIEKDILIKNLVTRAENLQTEIKSFKEYCFAALNYYMQHTAKSYGCSFSLKGNLSLTNSSSTYKVCKNAQEYIVLDEKLNIAKILIDKCLNKWNQNGNPNLKKVVDLAFSVDKRGKLNIPRILSLRKLDIQDQDWAAAMEAISHSITTGEARQFIRVYKKDKNEKWQNISLDIARL